MEINQTLCRALKIKPTNISLLSIVYRKITCLLQKSQLTIRDVFLGQMCSISIDKIIAYKICHQTAFSTCENNSRANNSQKTLTAVVHCNQQVNHSISITDADNQSFVFFASGAFSKINLIKKFIQILIYLPSCFILQLAFMVKRSQFFHFQGTLIKTV